jgi:hypothetical protein
MSSEDQSLAADNELRMGLLRIQPGFEALHDPGIAVGVVDHQYLRSLFQTMWMPLNWRRTSMSASAQSIINSFGPFSEASTAPYSGLILERSSPATSAWGAVSFEAGAPAEHIGGW